MALEASEPMETDKSDGLDDISEAAAAGGNSSLFGLENLVRVRTGDWPTCLALQSSASTTPAPAEAPIHATPPCSYDHSPRQRADGKGRRLLLHAAQMAIGPANGRIYSESNERLREVTKGGETRQE